jgi:hypothetical protein
MKLTITMDMKGSIVVDAVTGMPVTGGASGTNRISLAGIDMVQKLSSKMTVK